MTSRTQIASLFLLSHPQYVLIILGHKIAALTANTVLFHHYIVLFKPHERCHQLVAAFAVICDITQGS